MEVTALLLQTTVMSDGEIGAWARAAITPTAIAGAMYAWKRYADTKFANEEAARAEVAKSAEADRLQLREAQLLSEAKTTKLIEHMEQQIKDGNAERAAFIATQNAMASTWQAQTVTLQSMANSITTFTDDQKKISARLDEATKAANSRCKYKESAKEKTCSPSS